MREVRVKGVVADRPEGHFLLVMADESGRIAAVPTGLLEGRAIALRLKTGLAAPQFHDFVVALLERLEAVALRVELGAGEKGGCTARFYFRSGDREQSLACLPGDGVALSLSARIPLLVEETLFGRFIPGRRDRRARKPGSLGPLTEAEVRELTRDIETLSAEEFWRRVGS